MKNHAPLIALGVAVLALLGIGFLSTSSQKGTPPPAETPTVSEEGEKENVEGTIPAVSGEVPNNVPTGGDSVITGYTVWKTYAPKDWGITFRINDEWELYTNDVSKDGTLEQVSFDAGTFTVLVAEDNDIAEPSRLTPKTYTRVIAGQDIEVREYGNPNETYAYYLFFTITLENDAYNFSIKNRVKDKTEVDDFLSRVTLK